MKRFRRELRINSTDAERFLWSRIRSKQFFGFRFLRQYSIGPYIIDFFCPNKKLAVEIDGSQHKEQVLYDQARTEFLKKLDINVLRFNNLEVLTNIAGVLKNMEEYINHNPS